MTRDRRGSGLHHHKLRFLSWRYSSTCLFVQKVVRVSPVDVTGRFDSVTGRRSLSLALYHKRKGRKRHLFIVPFPFVLINVYKFSHPSKWPERQLSIVANRLINGKLHPHNGEHLMALEAPVHPWTRFRDDSTPEKMGFLRDYYNVVPLLLCNHCCAIAVKPCNHTCRAIRTAAAKKPETGSEKQQKNRAESLKMALQHGFGGEGGI